MLSQLRLAGLEPGVHNVRVMANNRFGESHAATATPVQLLGIQQVSGLVSEVTVLDNGSVATELSWDKMEGVESFLVQLSEGGEGVGLPGDQTSVQLLLANHSPEQRVSLVSHKHLN